LVTGATGFLGSWLSPALVQQGNYVTRLVRGRHPKGNIQNIRCVIGILRQFEIQDIIHLAAQPLVKDANDDPLPTFRTNILGTWNILEAARKSPYTERVIVASTDRAYGEGRKKPYSEEDCLHGVRPYGVSKSCADLLAQSYFKTYGLPVSITRCGNTYGGGDLNFSRIVPYCIRRALHGKQPVLRGKSIRGYTYVEDIVSGYLALLNKMGNRKIHGQAFNFSAGNYLTPLEMTNRILKLANSKTQPVSHGWADLPAIRLSSKKARRVLGWKPKYSMEQGLKRTIKWYAEYFKR